MPFYLYRLLKPSTPKTECPIIELEHSWKESLSKDPITGYALERIYTPPNLSKGYSAEHTKQLLSDKNISQHGFSKYVRDPLSNCYVKTAGQEGPKTFSVK